MRAVEAEQAGLVGDRALLLDRIDQPEPVIGAQGRAGDGDPGTIDPPLGIEVDKFHRHTAFRETDRTGHAGDAAPHDQRPGNVADVLRSHTAFLL